jgi:hypothetical protein
LSTSTLATGSTWPSQHILAISPVSRSSTVDVEARTTPNPDASIRSPAEFFRQQHANLSKNTVQDVFRLCDIQSPVVELPWHSVPEYDQLFTIDDHPHLADLSDDFMFLDSQTGGGILDNTLNSTAHSHNLIDLSQAGSRPLEVTRPTYPLSIHFSPVMMNALSQTKSTLPRLAWPDWIPFSNVLTFPFENLYDSTSSRLLRQQPLDMQALHMILHRLINDKSIAGVLEHPDTNLDKLFQVGINHLFSLGTHCLSNIIGFVAAPYRLALVWGIFLSPLVLGDGPALNVVITRGPFATTAFPISWSMCYPLQYTCQRQDLATTKILLSHITDPELCRVYDPIRHLLQKRQRQDYSARLQILDLLLKHGVRLNVEETSWYGTPDWSDEELSLFEEHCPEHSFEIYFRGGALIHILKT